MVSCTQPSGTRSSALLPDSRLRIIPLSRSHVRRWDDEYVVYDQRCGETHLLYGPVADLFAWLREGPCVAHDLVARLAAADHDEIDDPESFVEQVIRELQTLQLLEIMPGNE
jgi:PqqD family protein of HPr-rel-A system